MQLVDLSNELEQLGLSNKEAKVYAACLLLGPAPAQRIAEQAQLNRPTTYDILYNLGELGLISQSDSGTKKVFVPHGIDSLTDLLERQAATIVARKKKLESLATRIADIQRPKSGDAPTIRFISGKPAIDAMWKEVMRKTPPGIEILSVTNHDKTLPVYPDRLKTNAAYRVSKRLSSKQFYYNSHQSVPSDAAILKETIRLTEAMPADITLYDNLAVFVTYGESPSQWTAVVLENYDIVQSLRSLFALAWANESC